MNACSEYTLHTTTLDYLIIPDDTATALFHHFLGDRGILNFGEPFRNNKGTGTETVNLRSDI
jgi:hypothetical protein